jgi:hypothetical protein
LYRSEVVQNFLKKRIRMSKHLGFVTNYEVRFESVFTSEPIQQNFREFLERNLNAESLLFVLAVSDFKKIKVEKEKVKKALQILMTYVTEGSDQEINVSSEVRKKCVRAFSESHQLEKSNELVVPSTVFEEAVLVVQRELRDDAFARFVRSESFIRFCKLKGEAYLDTIADNISEIARNALSFRPTDFLSRRINDRDVTFILRLSEDSPDWTPIRRTRAGEKEKNQYAYISKTSYAIGDSMDLKLFKITGVLPYSAEQVMHSITRQDTSTMYDANSTCWEPIEYLESTDTDYACVHCNFEMSLRIPFMKKRHSMQVITMCYDPSRQCYIWIGKTSTQYSEKSDKVINNKRTSSMIKAEYLYGYVLYKISDNKMRYVHVSYADLKMKSMSDTLFKMAVKKRAKGIHEGFGAVCELMAKESFTRPTNDCGGILRTLDEFQDRYIKTGKPKIWDTLRPPVEVVNNV